MPYFIKSEKIKTAISQLAKYRRLWLDTETAEYWTPNSRLSLIQILTAESSEPVTDSAGNTRDYFFGKISDRAIVLDVLDRADAIEYFITQIMVNSQIEKVFHNASFDLKYLGGKQRAKNVTCTLKMARKISKQRLGTSNLKLKTLAVELCNFQDVDAATGASNWGKRPLSEKQIHYAKMDVVYLAKLHQYLLDFNTAQKSVDSSSVESSVNTKSILETKTMANAYNSFNVTQVRVAFECPRLFYLNYHHNCKTLFIPADAIKGIGNIFHKQAEEFIDFVQSEPQIKALFQLPAKNRQDDAIALQMQQLFYQAKFYPFLQANINSKPNLAPALYQVWTGLSNLIKQWSTLLISNRSHCKVQELFIRTFVGKEVRFEHIFTLPNGTQKKLIGKFDSLIYDFAKNRPCVVEYKTYEPVDPSSQLAQVALYSYILWQKKEMLNDSAVYCVLPEFKAYNYTWEELEATVHQLIPNKLQQMQQWVDWKKDKPNAPPATTSPHLCQICPQQTECQGLFGTEIKPVKPIATPKVNQPSQKTNSQPGVNTEEIGQKLVDILQSYNINVAYKGAAAGSSFIRIKLKPDLGVKVASIANRSEDLKVHLAISMPPLIATQAGYVSVDVPRKDRQTANFYDYIQENKATDAKVKIALGINLEGKLIEADLSDPNTCHFLVGGTTGSGKSEFLRSLLLSLLYAHSPQRLKIALVDPKRVTFPEFESNPWLLSPVVKDSDNAIALMEQLVKEMERRYKLFEANKCPHLDAYNKKHVQQPQKIEPRIVCIFDEYADFMSEKETCKAIEQSIKRLGAMARAAGIHLIVATQRPEAKVVTPLIRSNLPGRIALRTASEADSKIILGSTETKAAYLLGKGDLLYQAGAQLERLQSLFASEVRFPQTSNI